MLPKIRLKKTEQDAVAISHEGVKWYFFLLFNHFFRLMGLNLLTIACLLSVVLFPTGMAAACRAVLVLTKGRGGLFWEEYRLEFKDRILKKFGAWALMMLIPVALALWTRIFGLDAHISEWILYIGFLLSCAVQAYFFVVTAAMDLPLSDCLINAFALAVLEWPTTLAIAAALILTAALGILLYPYSTMVLFLLFFGCFILFVCQRGLQILRKRDLLLPRSGEDPES